MAGPVFPAAARSAAPAGGGAADAAGVGVGYLLPVLSGQGHTSVAYRLLAQDALPSWRYTIDQGATTIWERWDGWTREGGFQSPLMNSFNHYALGAVGEWLYRFVLGIELAPDAVGFDRLVLRPHPGGQFRWARGSYRSVRGQVTVDRPRQRGQHGHARPSRGAERGHRQPALLRSP
jgi:alpha-L-rhamnosidase